MEKYDVLYVAFIEKTARFTVISMAEMRFVKGILGIKYGCFFEFYYSDSKHNV